MSFILAFLGTRTGRFALAGIGIIGLLFGVYWYGHRSGRQAGQVQGAKETADTLTEQMKSDRAQFAAALASASTLIAKQNAIIDQENAAISIHEQKIAALEQQRKATNDTISKLSDQAVVLDLVERLQIRDPKDMTPTLYPNEVRRADTIVADYALQSQKLDETNAKVQAMNEKIGALETKSTATDQKLSLALDYIDRSDKRFLGAVQVIYHLSRPSLFRRIVTLGIAREKKVPEITPIVPPDKPKELAK